MSTELFTFRELASYMPKAAVPKIFGYAFSWPNPDEKACEQCNTD